MDDNNNNPVDEFDINTGRQIHQKSLESYRPALWIALLTVVLTLLTWAAIKYVSDQRAGQEHSTLQPDSRQSSELDVNKPDPLDQPAH